MSNNLYAEAIAEAKQLREMAEQNAKNKIIEAVTPRIKALIEAQIMGVEDEPIEDEELTGVDLASLEDEGEVDATILLDLEDEMMEPLPEDELLEPPAPEDESFDEEDENTTVTVNAQGDVNISVAEGRGRRRALGTRTRSTAVSGKVNLRETCNSVRRQAKRMDAMLQGLQFNKLNEKQRTLIKKAYQELLSEALLIKRLLLKEGANDRLTTSYIKTIKEIKEMTRRSSAIFRRLFEIDDGDVDEIYGMREEDEEFDDDELGGEEEAAAEDVDVDAASTALEDLGTALGLDVVVGEEGEEGEEEEVEEDGEEEEIDLGEIHLGEADEEEVDEADDAEATDEVYEIDENILRREIRRLRKLRESDGVDPGVLDNFGGGSDEGDMFVDVDEDDLLNALADELGDAPAPTVENRRRRQPRRRNHAPRANQRRSAQIQTENKKLRKQLTEMNLFNAKLLYVNKLMQNTNVTQKQQRAIVEALDNAKTIREAKFLYQGLAKSLVKRTRNRKMNESAGSRKLLSSASKSTRRGSASLNEDTVAQRWATLAGIRK